MIIDKFTKKYLKIAKCIADDNDACYSRKIGSVLIGPDNEPISFGYNGPVRKVPHTDTKEYLEHLYNNLLTNEDKNKLNEKTCGEFIDKYTGCKTCPRRILGIPSGQRLELCSCSHSERNTLAWASIGGKSTKGSTMYCYCDVPCHECTIHIIQSLVKKVVCIEKPHPLYSPSSLWLFKNSQTELIRIPQSEWETFLT